METHKEETDIVRKQTCPECGREFMQMTEKVYTVRGPRYAFHPLCKTCQEDNPDLADDHYTNMVAELSGVAS